MLRLHTLLRLIFVAAATFCVIEAFPNPQYSSWALRRSNWAYANRNSNDASTQRQSSVYQIPPRYGVYGTMNRLCTGVLDEYSRRMCQLYNSFSASNQLQTVQGMMPLPRF